MQRSSDVLSASKSFASLLLPPHVQQALRDAGFRRPSPVQEAALPLARLGADLIVQAKAGTGKTLVFAAAAVERVDLANAAPQVLVLAPTREIALQASEAVALCAAALPPPGLACSTFIGGLPVEEDEKQLRRACHVAVGTTGRIVSLIQRGALKTGAVRMLVLDEADKLLADSFRKDVLAIIEAVPPKRQLLALSATYAPAALQQLRGLMGGRQQEVLLCCEDTALLAVRQCYRMLPSPGGASEEAAAEGQASPDQQQGAAGGGFGPHFEARLAALLSLLSSVSFQQAVVFCKYKADAEEVAERLLVAGYPAAHLSAQRTQLQRIEALNALRDFRLRVAVTTDLVARGVDLDRVNLVVNLELPVDAATYMHRVGRAGRFGTRGLSVTLLEGPEQLVRLEGYLQEMAGGQVTELPEEVPEDWYLHAAQLAQHAQQGQQAAPAVGMGPATPATAGSPLAAAASWQDSSTGLLADIATASLWGEQEGEGNGLLEAIPPPALPPPPPLSHQHPPHQPEESDVDLSYTVVPKPAAGSSAAAAAATATSPKQGSPATSPASGKPLVSSLTAAVAAASSKAAAATAAAAAARPSPPLAASQGLSNGNGNGHRCGRHDLDSSVDSADSWQSTSDDDYSNASSDDDATAAPLADGTAPPPASFKPLRRVSSASSGSSAGSVRSGGSGGSGGGSSSGSSGRQASRPAPIPGRPQPPEQQMAGSYEGRSGGGLAEVASESSLCSSEAATAAAGVLGTSQEDEPSFRDSWLVEGEAQVAHSAAEEQRRLRLLRQAEAAAAAAAPTVDLKPHRVRSPKAAAAQAAKAAARAQAAATARQAAAAAAAARQAAAQRQRQQAQQAKQGHYWEVVRSVQRDVQGRLGSSHGGVGGHTGKSMAPTAGSAAGEAARRSAAAATASEDSSDDEFTPVVPRQRRPLGSAQLAATHKRQGEAAAALAAEAAALELMAEQAATEEAAAAEAAAAAGAAAGADAAAAAAEQQRQWTEFWHAHYAYYGCYPREATWQAGAAPTEAPTAAIATGAQQPVAAACGVAAAAAATDAAGLLPPPPPAPPAPPPALSAATWASASPEYPAEQGGTTAAGEEAAAHGTPAAGDVGWVHVPASLLARYQQLEWEQWQRSHAEWQQLWEQYKQYWSDLYAHQQAQLDAQQAQQAQHELEAQQAQRETSTQQLQH